MLVARALIIFARTALTRYSNVVRIHVERKVLQHVAIVGGVRARLTGIINDFLVGLEVVLDVSLSNRWLYVGQN